MMRFTVALVGVAVASGQLADAEPARLRPGKYKLTLPVVILETNKGSAWDPKDAPDPIVSVTLQSKSGRRVLTCKQKNTFRPMCLDGTEVDVDATSTIAVRIEDEDGTRNDSIATVAPTLIAQPSNVPRSKIALTASATSQVKSIALVLAPVESRTPAACDETACILNTTPCCAKFDKVAAAKH